MAPKITVHWLSNSRAQRVLWTLEELELPYEIKKYERTEKKMAPPELKEVHPLGKSPIVVIEEDGQTITLAESGAIIEFLIERYGQGKFVVPPTGNLQERATYLYWLHFAEGTAMGPLIMTMVFTVMPKQAPFFLRPLVSLIANGVLSGFVNPNVKAHFDLIEAQLTKTPFFVGNDITGADFMMSYVLEAVEFTADAAKYPRITAWLKTVSERPAYLAALGKGGKSDLAAFIK